MDGRFFQHLDGIALIDHRTTESRDAPRSLTIAGCAVQQRHTPRLRVPFWISARFPRLPVGSRVSFVASNLMSFLMLFHFREAE
jgi:hypothetical protein